MFLFLYVFIMFIFMISLCSMLISPACQASKYKSNYFVFHVNKSSSLEYHHWYQCFYPAYILDIQFMFWNEKDHSKREIELSTSAKFSGVCLNLTNWIFFPLERKQIFWLIVSLFGDCRVNCMLQEIYLRPVDSKPIIQNSFCKILLQNVNG